MDKISIFAISILLLGYEFHSLVVFWIPRSSTQIRFLDPRLSGTTFRTDLVERLMDFDIGIIFSNAMPRRCYRIQNDETALFVERSESPSFSDFLFIFRISVRKRFLVSIVRSKNVVDGYSQARIHGGRGWGSTAPKLLNVKSPQFFVLRYTLKFLIKINGYTREILLTFK